MSDPAAAGARPIWFGSPAPGDFNAAHDGSLAGRMGVEVTEVRPQGLSARLPYLAPGSGSLSVGAESLGSIAAAFTVDPARFTVVGVDINLTAYRALTRLRDGAAVLGEAAPAQLGPELQVWTIHLRAEGGEDIATSRITVKVIPTVGEA